MKLVEFEIGTAKVAPCRVWYDDSDEAWHSDKPVMQEIIRKLTWNTPSWCGHFGEQAKPYHVATWIAKQMEPQGWVIKILTEEPPAEEFPEDQIY